MSGIVDKELVDLINGIREKCTVCLKYKKASLKPVVGFSLSRDFNDVISMNLKEMNGFKILHLIDHATRYSAATIVKSKQKEEIVKAIFKIWITLFGSPNEILSDNGGEFNNDLLRDLSDHLNVFTERHNAILGNMIHKLLIDNSNGYSVDIIVAWAVSAKNALHNYYGFSPNQLEFGKNPNFPSVLTDKPPALEEKTSSEIIANHLNAMHAARKAFIEAEASEKLRRVIKAKTRVSTGIIYQPGDIVYYKRNDSNQWKGPGTVSGRENKQILVKHGVVYIRAHACRLQHVQNSQMTSTKENIESENSGNVENKNELLDIYDDSDIEINNEIKQVNNAPQTNENNESNQANAATSTNFPKANDNIEYLNPHSNDPEKALIKQSSKRQSRKRHRTK